MTRIVSKNDQMFVLMDFYYKNSGNACQWFGVWTSKPNSDSGRGGDEESDKELESQSDR